MLTAAQETTLATHIRASQDATVVAALAIGGIIIALVAMS